VFEDAQVTLCVNAERIQWSATPVVNAERRLEALPLLGSYLEKSNWLRNLMGRWLPNCPPIKRVAFIAPLLQPVTDPSEGMRLLDRYLRYLEVHPESGDLLYRINRRKPSTAVPGVDINRVCTWALSTAFLFEVEVSPLSASQREASPQGLYCALGLDVNTMPENQATLAQDRLPELLSELVNTATEVATRGDIRELPW
jgi:hypothetical protein